MIVGFRASTQPTVSLLALAHTPSALPLFGYFTIEEAIHMFLEYSMPAVIKVCHRFRERLRMEPLKRFSPSRSAFSWSRSVPSRSKKIIVFLHNDQVHRARGPKRLTCEQPESVNEGEDVEKPTTSVLRCNALLYRRIPI